MRYGFVLGRQLTAVPTALVEIPAEPSTGRASPSIQNKAVASIVSLDISEYLVQNLYSDRRLYNNG